MRYATHTLALAFTLALGGSLLAQTAAKPASDAPAAKPAQEAAARPRPYFDSFPTRTFYLKYANQQADENEIVTAIRQTVSPEDRVFMVPSQSAILLRAPAEDVALAQKILDDLDRPKKAWRLTYTITEMDGDKRLGIQHYSMDLVDGQQTTVRQGSRVPIATGSYSSGAPGAIPVQTQFTYRDVGITFDATLTSQANGARLLSSIEQNGVVDAPAGGVPAPIERNSSLKGAYLLTSGKPLILGAMDLPGSTHHLQIEALIEPLP